MKGQGRTTRANDEHSDDRTLDPRTSVQIDAQLQERIDSLFVEAIEVPDDQRVQFVKSRAQNDDPRVRDAVLKLLDADARVDTNFAARSPLNLKSLTTDESIPDRRIGEHVGDYVIQERIDSGGFGTVYRATREQPYREDVAIKLLHQNNLADAAVVQRVLREMQALSDLRHPNIVTQLQANVTDEGEPYIVMEFVDGVALDDYCNRNQLSINERLRLFQKVCEAVQFAHSQGWVHRDLKPSNILVTQDGVPKLLDFGIAKLTKTDRPNPAVTRDPTITFGPVGTPQYMSPEQFNGDDPRASTDIYALGAILYELISGHRVFDVMCEGVDRVLMDAIRRAVCETMPKRPSTLVAARPLSATGVSMEQVADERRSNPASLKRCLEGDVDNIAMMALRKEPGRRYSSAAAVAEDIQRWLEHRPVQARPDSAAYRLQKFVQRNRIPLAVAACLATALVVTTLSLRSRDRIRSDRNAERVSRLLEASSASISEDNVPRAVAQLYLAGESAEAGGVDDLSPSINRLLGAWSRHLGTPLSTRANLRTTFSSSGNRLAVADKNRGKVTVWDTRRLKKLHEIVTPLERLSFSPRGTSLVGVHDNEITFWNLAKPSVTSTNLPDSIGSLVDDHPVGTGEALILCTESDRRVTLRRVFNVSEKERMPELVAQADLETDIVDAYILNDQLVALVSGLGTERVIELRESDSLTLVYNKKTNGVGARHLSPNGEYLALNYREATNQAQATPLKSRCVVLDLRQDTPTELALIDGRVVDVADNGDVLVERKQDLVRINCVASTETVVQTFDGRWTATFDELGRIHGAEVLMSPQLHVRGHSPFKRRGETVKRRLFPVAASNKSNFRDLCAFDSTGHFLVFDHRFDDAMAGHRVPWLWAVEPLLIERPPTLQLDEATERVRHVAIIHGADREHYVVVASGAKLYCWDGRLWIERSVDSTITSMIAGSERGVVIIGDMNGVAHWMQLPDLATTRTEEIANAPIRSLDVGRGGELLVAVQNEVTRFRKMAVNSVAIQGDSAIQSVRLSADGKAMFVASREKLLAMGLDDLSRTELSFGNVIGQLCDVAGRQREPIVAMIQQGRAVIMRGRDGVRVLGDEKICSSVALRDDGAVAAAGYQDGSIQFWDVPTHRALSRRMYASKAAIEFLAFANDGRKLISCSERGEVSVWDVGFTAALDELDLRRRLETLTSYRLKPGAEGNAELAKLSHTEWLEVATRQARSASE